MAGASSGISLVLASISRWARTHPVAHVAARTAGGPGCRQRGPRRGRSCRPRRPAQQAGRPWPGGRRGGAALLALVPGHGRQGVRRAGRHRGEVAVQRRVERLGVGVPEDPGEGAGTGRADPPGPRVAPPAEDGQRVLRAAGRPLGDRGRGVVPGGGERADRQGQHELQRMPPAQPRPRVRDACQPLAQAAAGFISGKNPGQLPGRDVDQRR